MRAFILLLSFIYFLQAAYVKEYEWEEGESFLKFLQNKKIDKSLYFGLDENDQEIVTEIRAGIKYHILYSDNGEIEQILIPVNDEIQVHMINNNGIYKFSTQEVSYKEEIKSVFVDIKTSPHQDILDKTNNYSLANEFLSAFKRYVDFRREIKKGDRLVILYKQKIRLGKIYGDIDVESAMIERSGKAKYIIRYKDKYYDETGKLPDIVDSWGFSTPCRYRRISSRFTHKRWHPILKRYRAHLGIDYAAPTGTPVKASAGGRVTFVGWKGGYGKTIEILHANGYKTLYAHLSRFQKGIRGKSVKQGQVIGYIGTSGRSTGPHLHFGLYRGGKAINPAKKIVIVKTTKTPSMLENSDFKNLLALNKTKIDDILKNSNHNDSINKFDFVSYDNVFNYTFSIEDKKPHDNSTINENYAMAKVVNEHIKLQRENKIKKIEFIEVAKNDIKEDDLISIDEENTLALNEDENIVENSNNEVDTNLSDSDNVTEDENLVASNENEEEIITKEIEIQTIENKHIVFHEIENEEEILAYINKKADSLTDEKVSKLKKDIKDKDILLHAEKLGKTLVNM